MRGIVGYFERLALIHNGIFNYSPSSKKKTQEKRWSVRLPIFGIKLSETMRDLDPLIINGAISIVSRKSLNRKQIDGTIKA